MTMLITPRIALEIVSHEAIVRQAYKDSVGVWTWLVGLTSATGHDVTRYIGKPATMERCLDVFVWALNNYAEAVRAEFKGHTLSEEQFGAALSFHWNTGAIRSATWPDLWKRGELDAARASFMSWKKPPEILDRRKKEAALLFDGKWSADGTVTEYTRVRASGTPDWGSAVKVDIANTLARLFADDDGAVDAAATEPEDNAIADAREALKTARVAISTAETAVELLGQRS